MAVQVNGKVRDQITVSTAAKAAEKVQPWLEGKTIRKVIVVPGRLATIAVS